ncbi:protein SET DOMAIN GROUP 40 isoform X2 [Henckelia pumila]|uniref:protein SET DOMAIN GROUP 40 isoform X2 n=1 Tax=Henckelia pumila TaxID=405737 RepID=UPI003C6DF5E2
MEEEKEANLRNFLEWAASLGISDSPDPRSPSPSCLGHSLSISHFPQAGGRGFAAVRDIKKGELILRVPKAALLTADAVISKEYKLSAALDKYPLLSSTQILSIALLHEVSKGRSSWWYPYITQIPRSYDLLFNFNQLEIEALQIDDAIWTTEKAVHKCKMEWEEASPLMSELHLKPQFVTYQAWLWASATISSRTMYIPWNTAGCLCPVGDFFNYAPPGEESDDSGNSSTCGSDSFSNTLSSCEGDTNTFSTQELIEENQDRLIDAGYSETASSYCFYARINYTRGDQVLLSYGTYTNLELLEHYGFLLHENPSDKAFIPLEPEMFSLYNGQRESLYISHDGKPSFSLLMTARLWVTPRSKRKSIKHIVCSGFQISVENEEFVLKWIVEKCRLLLSGYATSIEEDELLLCSLEEIQNYNKLSENREASAAPKDEIWRILESNNVERGELCGKLNISLKTRRSIDRWKLAVQWRRNYKKILFNCISQCDKILDINFC